VIDGVSLKVLYNFKCARLPEMEGLCVCRDKPVFVTVSLPAETMSQVASYYFQWVVCLSQPADFLASHRSPSDPNVISDPEMETVATILVDEWKPETNGFSVRLKPHTIPDCTRESVAQFRRAHKLHGVPHSEPCTKIRVTLVLQPVVVEDQQPVATQVAPIVATLVATSERLYVSSDRHMRDWLKKHPAPIEPDPSRAANVIDLQCFGPAPAPSTSQTSVSSTSGANKKPRKRGTGNETRPAEDSVSLPEAQRVKDKSDREYSDQQRLLLHAELETVALLEAAFQRGDFRPAPASKEKYVPVKSDAPKSEIETCPPKRSGRATTL
jgi:hypothetical protein